MTGSGASGVVVLGGGLAGVAAAQELGRHKIEVTLVDRNDYHQFQPLLYQVATSQLPAEDIARPLRSVFAEQPSVRVVTADVTAVSTADCSLTLADGTVLAGEHLVLAAGARPSFFGIPGAEENSLPLYSVADAERLRRHLQGLLRTEPSDKGGALDVVVVGAGATGVETAGATAELFQALAREGLVAPTPQVVVVDRGRSLLPQSSDTAHDYALRKLSEAGATVRLGVGVTSVNPDGVDLDDGTSIQSRTVVWAGGEAGASVLESTGVRLGRGGRVDVRGDLTVEGHPRVYGVGDSANIPSADGEVLPQLGAVAQQAGHWAALNILRDMDRQEPVPFRYKDKGIMAMIGRNAAVAEVGRHRHQVEGPLAFAAWLGVHALLLSGVHSQTDAFLSWAWDYFDRDHAALVEEQSAPHRIAWGDADADIPHILIDSATS